MKLSDISPRLWSVLFLGVVGLLGGVFLHTIGIAALNETYSFQFFADSATYHKLARGDLGEHHSLLELITFSANYLGPFLVLELARQDYYVILCINLVIFWISAELILSISKNASRSTLYILLFANPITVSSLLAVNKEILSFLAMAVLLFGLAKRKWWVLVLAVIFCLLVRWQFVLFGLMAIFVYSKANPLHERRFFLIALALILASLIIWKLDFLMSGVRHFNLADQKYGGSGLYEKLVDVQKHGFYWLVFIPKAIHLLFGLGLRIDRLFDPTNLYNDVWQLLHSTALLFVFCLLVARRQWQLRSDLIYVSLLYLTVFVLTPIYVPRYFYPIYILWVAVLSMPESGPLFRGAGERLGWPRSKKSGMAMSGHPNGVE